MALVLSANNAQASNSAVCVILFGMAVVLLSARADDGPSISISPSTPTGQRLIALKADQAASPGIGYCTSFAIDACSIATIWPFI